MAEQKGTPPVGDIQFGSFRHVQPISQKFGFDRGQPVDRYYIAHFLSQHAAAIRGRVLEIGDNSYTKCFGGDRVTHSDILDVNPKNPNATLTGDLTDGNHLPSAAFDSIIFTQALHMIYDFRIALHTLQRILTPGGALLATFPGITPLDRQERAKTWFWSFTSHSAERFFQEAFPGAALEIQTYGNVLSAIAFLEGLAAEELDQEELDATDPAYQVIVAVKAMNPLA